MTIINNPTPQTIPVHPQYTDILPDWIQLRDCYDGERVIKAAEQIYLPPTSGMVQDGLSTGQPGFTAYEAYKRRAIFHGMMRDAADTYVGLLHKKPSKIELPEKLEPMRYAATSDNESLEMLERRISLEQLRYGRCGMLLDVPTGKGPNAIPYISFYDAMRIVNWDIGTVEEGKRRPQVIVLDETEYVRTSDLVWRRRVRYRVCAMSSEFGTLVNNIDTVPASGFYGVALTLEDATSLPMSGFTLPSIAGRKLNDIPFVFVNTRDILAQPDRPPLLSLSNLDLAIYRGEADYRQALFMQGQDTLVIIGATVDGAPIEGVRRTGAGAILYLPQGADAKYVGVASKGLDGMEKSITNDIDRAQQQGSRMLSTKGGDQQSGDALRTRVAAQTATLPNLAWTRAFALEEILKKAAIWVGADPNEVKVTPNTDFVDEGLNGQDALNWTQAKNMGMPISNQSLHGMLRRRGVTTETFADEMDMIEGEGGGLVPPGQGMPDPLADVNPGTATKTGGGTKASTPKDESKVDAPGDQYTNAGNTGIG